MNKENGIKLVRDIILTSNSPATRNQSLVNRSSVQQDKLSVVKGFTLLEVMIVTTILAALATTTVVALNPVELLAQMRDSQRMTTIGMLRDAVSLLIADRPATNLGDITRVHISLPSNNDNCADIAGLPALPAGQTYRCVTAANLTRIDGGGWIPLDFRGITDGAPFTVLPIDVTNTPTSFYSYIPAPGGRATITARIESIRQRTIHPPGVDGISIFATHFTAAVDRPPLGTGQVVVPLGFVSAPSYTFIGDLNTGIFSPGADAIGLSTAGILRMSIDNMGNVGIGTFTPGNRLTVAGVIHSTAGGFMFPDGTTQITAGGAGAGGGGALPTGTANQTLRHDGTNWVANSNLFNTGTNVGIGTTSPTERLEVVGNIISEGTAWTARTSPADNQWLSVTFGNGLFVATAQTGTGNRVMTSPDGINWTTRTSAADNSWVSVTFGDGLFVAVAPNQIMTSPNGINWTLRTSPANNVWRSVTFGNGLFVAVASSGTGNRVMTSEIATPVFVVTSAGRVGIGTRTPTERLDVHGNVRANSYLTPSDKRLKIGIASLENSLSRISSINPVSFRWKENNKPSIGLIAQNVEEFFPEIVFTEEKSGLKSVNYSALIPVLIQAINEQQQTISAQGQRIERLELELRR